MIKIGFYFHHDIALARLLYFRSNFSFMKMPSLFISKPVLLLIFLGVIFSFMPQQFPGMMFADAARDGIPFSKDPHVIQFNGRFLLYYSVHGFQDKSGVTHGWGIGIDESADLINWKRIGEVNVDSSAVYESKGIAAPCALVVNGKVNLFYQTYGNGVNDAICHAVSKDGIHFERNKTNPIFHPDGEWNCGRAIDAEVINFKGKYFLYYATRDKNFKIQMLGVAVASGNTDFSRSAWKNISIDSPILKPKLAWEGQCIEAASVIQKNESLFMFYAGAYNNAPQQIGLAKSVDGIHWVRVDTIPFLANGKPGEWNASESGHPHIFSNPSGDDYLFFQGNNDNGKTWYISNKKINWSRGLPVIK